MSKLSYLVAGAATLVLSAGPAFATVTVPEPASITMLGAGAVAAALIARYRRRK